MKKISSKTGEFFGELKKSSDKKSAKNSKPATRGGVAKGGSSSKADPKIT